MLLIKNKRGILIVKRGLLKILGISTAITLGIATNVMAADKYNITRLGGTDRFETAIEISKEFAKGDKITDAIIANCDNYADSISAAPLSVYKNAPILLTGAQDLNVKTKARLQEMNIKNVYILGGTGAVSSNVENQLKGLGYTVTRYGGANRIETNRKIMTAIPKDSWGAHPKVVNSYDWMQGFSVAADTKYDFNGKTYINPIFVISPAASSAEDLQDVADSLKTSEQDWKSKGQGLFVTFIDNHVNFNYFMKSSGAGNLSSTDVEKALYPDFDKIDYLESSYSTEGTNLSNILINHDYVYIFRRNKDEAYKVKGALLANSSYYIDTLSASALAAKKTMPIVMADKSIEEAFGYKPNDLILNDDIISTFSGVESVYYIGGKSVMPDGRESFLEGK